MGDSGGISEDQNASRNADCETLPTRSQMKARIPLAVGVEAILAV